MEMSGKVQAVIRLLPGKCGPSFTPSKGSPGTPFTGRLSFPTPGLGVVAKTKIVAPADMERRPTAS
jgi:hypothetical protein